MAYTAHLPTSLGPAGQRVVISDDRGISAHVVELPAQVQEPTEADEHLDRFGWRREANWVEVDDGWSATVVPTGEQ